MLSKLMSPPLLPPPTPACPHTHRASVGASAGLQAPRATCGVWGSRWGSGLQLGPIGLRRNGGPVRGALRPVARVKAGQVLRTGKMHTLILLGGSLRFCGPGFGSTRCQVTGTGRHKQPDPATDRISIPGETGRVHHGCRCGSHTSAHSEVLGRRQGPRGWSWQGSSSSVQPPLPLGAPGLGQDRSAV